MLSSLQTREAGNVGIPAIKTRDWGAMKFRGRCTKLPRLLIPSGTPELLQKLMKRYKRDSDAQATCSRSHGKREAKQRPGVQKSLPAPGPAPFSLVWRIFPAIVKAAFLVRRPCLWQGLPHLRVKRELLDSAAIVATRRLSKRSGAQR